MWITPKTNWQATYNSNGERTGDYVNVSDYNRICGNLQHILGLYAEYNKQRVDLEPFTSISITDVAHSTEWNIIERNLESLLNGYGGLNNLKDKMKIYLDNGFVPDYDELNRIESTTLAIYTYLPIEYQNQCQLQFSLGLDNIGIFSQRVEDV